MVLRNLVTRMRVPTTAALRLPCGPRISPAAGSWALATSFDKGEKASQGAKVFHGKAGYFDEEIDKLIQETREYRARDPNLGPKVVALSSGVMIVGMTCAFAYLLRVDDIKGSRK